MRRLKNKHLVPPTDFVYTDPDVGVTKERTYADWVSNARDRRRFNDLAVPLDLEAQMNDQLCGILPPEWCDRDPGDVNSWVNTSFGWNDFIEGMKSFGRWALQEAPLVEQEEADRRAAICVQCPLNVNVAGCTSCHRLASAITGAVAKKVSAHSDSLRACAICHCALKAMVWFPLEILDQNETVERQNLRPDFCWVKRGSSAREAT